MMFDVDVTETYSLFCMRLRNFENNEVFFGSRVVFAYNLLRF